MSREVGIETVSVINDLEANAFGVHTLAPEDFASLSDGNPNPRGNTAVISAGTGLGEAGLFFDGKSHHPFACEGGHADFAPIDDLQTEMLTWMRKQLSHVSWERIVSGGGIFHIYRFLRETGRGEEPAWLTEELTKGDPTIPVVQAALSGKSAMADQALDIFIACYGAEAGNLALKLMATGGVFLGGGIAPRILPKLQKPSFMRAFQAKGRMSDLMHTIPVKVILNSDAALRGAARAAAMALAAALL